MKKTRIADETFNEMYAKILKRNTEELKDFKKHIIEEFNRTKDSAVFLENLKIVAIANGNVKSLAEKSMIRRPSVYRILSKESNPSFSNVTILARNLGIEFFAKCT
jgi:DNA-binding phage protein